VVTQRVKRASIKKTLPRYEHPPGYQERLDAIRQSKYESAETSVLLETFKALKNEKWQLEEQTKEVAAQIEALQLEVIARMDEMGQTRLARLRTIGVRP